MPIIDVDTKNATSHDRNLKARRTTTRPSTLSSTSMSRWIDRAAFPLPLLLATSPRKVWLKKLMLATIRVNQATKIGTRLAPSLQSRESISIAAIMPMKRA